MDIQVRGRDIRRVTRVTKDFGVVGLLSVSVLIDLIYLGGQPAGLPSERVVS